jgi:murein DD-endopeptidase MepM/ murein hydrolase activator NlpD
MNMPKKKWKDNKDHWISKLRNKYRLVISNEDTFEEKFSFRLSRLNVFVVTGTIAILLIIATTFLIAFTPLREYIPGYTDVTLRKRVIQLERLADSLETDLKRKSEYMQNIKNIIEGRYVATEEDSTVISPESTISNDYSDVNYTRSSQDSILREEYEGSNKYDLFYNDNLEVAAKSSRRSFIFLNPLNGIVSNEFDLSKQHFGIDIVSKENEVVKATLDGTVIFSEWTVETGYVITIQHQGTFVSTYKHNSALLKKQGSMVKAGEPIAIVGQSGEFTSGPHLHFELWYNGTPVNPRDYISF